jgi:hypothetical protein
MHRQCGLAKIKELNSTPKDEGWQLTFSIAGDKLTEASEWLDRNHSRLYVVQADDPRGQQPGDALAYRVCGWACRREYLLAVLRECPHARFVRELWGFEASGL